jgi:FMN phosphatase YigB (HAD superfamily)
LQEAVQAYFEANTEMRELYRAGLSAEAYKMQWGSNDAERFRLLCARHMPKYGRKEWEALAKAWRDAWNAYDEHPVVFADAAPFLERMRTCGLRLVLVSGETRENRRMLLEKLGLMKYFAAVYAVQDVGHPKGELAFYEAVLSNEGVAAKECAIVGDDGTDDVGAGRLGIHTVHLVRATEYRPENTRRDEEYPFGAPDVVVHDLIEAADSIEALVR